MRLGGFFSAETAAQLNEICAALDRYGLSAIQAPHRLTEMSDEECIDFGEKARGLGIRIGEAGMWENLMHKNPDVRKQRINRIRKMLQKADLMGCDTVVSLVGSRDPMEPPIAPHPGNFSDKFRYQFREIVLRILEGLHLQHTKYTLEP